MCICVCVCVYLCLCVCVWQYHQWFCSAAEGWTQAVFAQSSDPTAQSSITEHVPPTGQSFASITTARLLFETRVILRISSYSWNKKQQHFSNTRSRVFLLITRPHCWRNELGTRKMAAHFDDDNLWELAESCMDLFIKALCQFVNRFGWSRVSCTILR